MVQNDSERDHFCVSVLKIRTTFRILLVIDVILHFNLLICMLVLLLSGDLNGNEVFEKVVVSKTMLLTFSVGTEPLENKLIQSCNRYFQLIGLSTAVLSVVAQLKTWPYAQIPHLLYSVLFGTILIWLIGNITNVLLPGNNDTWICVLATCAFLLIEQLFFLYVKCLIFRKLIRKRRVRKEMEKRRFKL